MSCHANLQNKIVNTERRNRFLNLYCCYLMGISFRWYHNVLCWKGQTKWLSDCLESPREIMWKTQLHHMLEQPHKWKINPWHAVIHLRVLFIHRIVHQNEVPAYFFFKSQNAKWKMLYVVQTSTVSPISKRDVKVESGYGNQVLFWLFRRKHTFQMQLIFNYSGFCYFRPMFNWYTQSIFSLLPSTIIDQKLNWTKLLCTTYFQFC